MTMQRTLRDVLASARIGSAAGAHNALTARLVEQAGYDVVWASGLEISASMAVPDANILTMSDVLAVAASMAAKVRIPVLADCDSGFGGTANVAAMVRAYEAAGIQGVCVEDKTFPKLNSFVAGNQSLVPIEDFCGKLAAARENRSSDAFVVIARIEAFIAGFGLHEALVRARAYEAAGADALLIHSKRADATEIEGFLAAYDGELPVVVVPTTYKETTLTDLQRMGASLAIYANQGLRSAISSTRTTLRTILECGSAAAVDDSIAPLQEVFDLQDMADHVSREARYEAIGRDVAMAAESPAPRVG
ncbi:MULTISPECIES: isocitrate lyase/phosphoenolpyruvate mutase family protein [Clavibacter]|uniref:Phosphoenolpyruvate phosphomutase n=1 Tax=Clavibacter tessellarius TaxID=31965 RepID=A0A154V2I5_9MICO|nr:MULTISPECIES: isocitrate lyase/phosphoenolpyruvate mutase family protein [Clavibacter]KZC95517.1 phosphoenolpyruvate phosphomutase [Clavibacter michiganensis subsp. tessellarius]MDA3805922.1 isocitrate lyase/phosphoenolpyruvate mutase family protein [Clavibacter sp. CT19]